MINCVIRTDPSSFDLDLICAFIQQSYWGQGRARHRILESFKNSVCFGAFVESQQVGFARVVTDHVYHAYIFDLFVVAEHRKQGIAYALMTAILEHKQLREVTGFMLSTRDAHGLYERFGFKTATDPSRYMVLTRPEPS